MSYSNRIKSGAAGTVLLAIVATAAPAQADGTGAFVGGLLAGKVMNNMHQRTEAEQQQAYYAQQSAQQQQVQQAAPAAPAAKSPQQRLDELDKLAAGGYITPDEYKKKKQAIIDSM
jgi:hypothetical protein